MEWSRLLSTKRERAGGNFAKAGDLRSEFEKDYHRIIGSASFRRLQDKTQVFPLDKSDFVRTRLTHFLHGFSAWVLIRFLVQLSFACFRCHSSVVHSEKVKSLFSVPHADDLCFHWM